jgi:predicted transcriptional regulator YheO
MRARGVKGQIKKQQFSVRRRWKPLVDCIADLFGKNAEVVLHDLRHPESSVVYIRNGHVTGRQVGAPLTDLGFLMLRDAKRGKDSLGVYHSKTDTGKQLKCNAIILRDDQNTVVAMLCVNLDVTGTPAAILNGHRPPEHYHTRVSEVIDALILEAASAASLPATELSTAEKMRIIRQLHQQGVFLARGSVQQVSAQLGIAGSTVYKYIQTARSGAPVIKL